MACEKKLQKRVVFVSLFQACNNHFCVCSVFAGEGESRRRQHRSMWVHSLSSNQTAFFKICHVVLRDKFFSPSVTLACALVSWLLLRSNSNSNGSYKMDSAAHNGKDLRWWNKRDSHLLHHIYCSGRVSEHVRLNCEIILVVSSCW